MRVAAPARRYGVADEDIWHALRNAMQRLDDDVTIVIGPAHNGDLLEIGVLGLEGDDPVVVHAMALRPKFYPYL